MALSKPRMEMSIKKKILIRLRDKGCFMRPANLVEFYGFNDYQEVLIALNELLREGKVIKRRASFWRLAE